MVEMCLKASECCDSNFSCKQHAAIKLTDNDNVSFAMSQEIHNKRSCKHNFNEKVSVYFGDIDCIGCFSSPSFLVPINLYAIRIFWLNPVFISSSNVLLPSGPLYKNSSQLLYSLIAIFLVAGEMIC